MEELRVKAEQIGVMLTTKQLEQFDTYYHRLIEKNKVMNLTAITEYQEVIDKHFVDSLLLAGVRDLTGEMSVIDVGTGGGFPAHVRERLYAASDAIVALDSEMSSVRDEIIDAQNMFTIKANVVSDILINIQNLYHVANKREVLKIQDEFYQIFATQDLEQLERFSRELDIIAEGYKAQSLN